MKSYRVLAISVGKPRVVNYQKTTVQTAIYKRNVSDPLYLSETNLAGDVQADQKNHGGPDKALCAYCFKRYPHWEQSFARKLEWGVFGENLTIADLTEEEAYIGDTYQCGTAVIQVSQPRKPCFKLGVKLNVPTLAAQFQETGYTGFYFRVLKAGWVSADSDLRFISRPERTLSVAEINRIRYGQSSDLGALDAVLSIEALAVSWKNAFKKMSDNDRESR